MRLFLASSRPRAALALLGALALTGPSLLAQPAADPIDTIWRQHSNDPDRCWRDPTSHARVVRVTSGFESTSLPYFHQNIFTATGDLMLFTGRREQDQGYYTLNLRTAEVRPLDQQTGQNLVVLPRRRVAAFHRGDDVFLMELDGGRSRRLMSVPHGLLAEAAGFGFTADEKKLLFAYCDQLAATTSRIVSATAQKDVHVRRLDFIAAYEAMPKHNAIYSIDLDSGRLALVFQDTESHWLGHVQGSPTDPNLALFIHEGFVSVHIKNRLRLLDLRSGEVSMPRTGPLEQDSITHEFWDRSGRSIWYDIANASALGNLDLKTRRETRYVYGGEGRTHRSIHYAIGPGAAWAVGDGLQKDNPWLCLYRFSRRNPQSGEVPIERLCDFRPHYNNLEAHYLEPNPHLTPDAKWVLFTAHLKGNANEIWAVEIPKDAGT